MPEITPTPQFEDEIRAAVAAPAADEVYVKKLHARLMQQAVSSTQPRRRVSLRALWVAVIVLAALAASTLLIGPQRVVEAMRSLFGYLPGVGIVDQSAPLRVLAEPVSLTREGITVSVNQATLTASQTQIEVGISGVPLTAYPKDEAVTGCIEQSYLRLPDGTRQDIEAPIPPEVTEAVYVMACIFNTLPGTVPTNWELPLRFNPAPPDLTVMPVIEVTSTVPETDTQTTSVTEAEETLTPTPGQVVEVSVEKVIETTDGYILVGAVRPQLSPGNSIRISGVPMIHDAQGHKLAYTYPNEINAYELLTLDPVDQPFSFQIQAAGVAFPLSIDIPGKIITPGDPGATAEMVFDAGENPQPGQEWQLDQEIELAGHTLKLVSITVDSRNGYGFIFEAGPEIASLSVQIEGYTPVGGGGGYDGQGMINQSLSYAELPTGSLQIVLSDLMLASETQFWKAQWAPETARDWPTATPASYPVCLNADSFSQLEPLPAGLDGMVLLTEVDDSFRLVMAGLDGSNRQVLAEQASRGSFSPDGMQVAYPGNEGITILDLATNTSRVLPGASGYDLTWSPDGTQLAYVTSGEAYGVFVVALDGSQAPKQLSNLGYEALAGWSPDGQVVYFAIPSATGNGFLLRSVEVNSGVTQDLFILDDSSAKAPYPAVSPDGQWVAYRARDNRSVYLKAMGGASPAWLLIDSPGLATSAFAWEKAGHLLGVSVITTETQAGAVVLLQVDTCEAYLLPEVRGTVEGI